MNKGVSISIVVPVWDEKASLLELTERLLPVLLSHGGGEIIFIDDGSTDGSGCLLEEIQGQHSDIVKVIHLRKNCGKAVALQAGFNEAKGDYIVMMDADLQDQPEEIPKLLAALSNSGLDAVTGWKEDRHDPFVKTFPSKIFNMIVRFLSKLSIHDFNCGLKAFRKECLSSIVLYGQMHRFVLVLVASYGFKVGEVPVVHAARKHGISKYGLKRIYCGWMDIMTVFFITHYLDSPLYFFGFYGLLSFILSLLSAVFFLVMHVLGVLQPNFYGWRFSEHSLWMISPVLMIVGLMVIFFGLIGELITYYSTKRQNCDSYICRR